MGESRVSSFGIEVSDLTRSSAFYTDVLGLTVAFTVDNDNLEEVAVNDGAGGPTILLMRTKAFPAPGPEPKTGKVVLVTDDVSALHDAAVGAGATSEREPTPYPGTPYTIGMVRDFDGNLIEMIQMA
jgi:catechol 2,3-dioxygenase-like lactoylglutathione lyase family enzyme